MIRFIFLFSIIFFFSNCKSDSLGEKNNPNPTSQTIEVTYAEHFKFATEKGKSILILLDPETGKEERRFSQDNFKSNSLKLVALSSTNIGMMDILGAEDNIVGISNITYVANKKVLTRFKNGEIEELGDESTIPLEKLIASSANLVMYSGFGKEFPHQKQLEKLGIICMPNYDWRENHPLGKAEWIKVFGFLLGKEKEASDYFDKVKEKYLSLKKEASTLSASKTLISGNVIGDLWYAPAGESYNAVLFRDANIKYNYAKSQGTGSVALSLEQIISENQACAFWINPGTTTYKELEQMNPKASFLSAFQNKNVYCYSKAGNYFWEMSAIEPQKVLSDLIQICHPNHGMNNKMYFYSKLEE